MFQHNGKNSIAKLIRRPWNKETKALASVWIVIVLVDLGTRFSVFETNDQLNSSIEYKLDSEIYPTFTKSLQTTYLHKLASHVLPEDQQVTDTQVTAADSNEPPAGYWLSNEHHFKLVAIFKGIDSFAVFDRIVNKTGEQSLIEVRLGDLLGEFTVDSISDHAVGAKNKEKKRLEFILFEPSVTEI